MVVNGINKQGKPKGERHDDSLGCGKIKNPLKTDSAQATESGCGVQGSKQVSISPIEVFPACTEYPLALAWFWDTGGKNE